MGYILVYFKNANLLHQDLKPGNGSYTWNGITKGMQVVKQNYFMEVNDGKRTKFWLDKWIPGLNSPPTQTNDLFRFYQTIDELILPQSNSWNVELLHRLFDSNAIQKILSIFLDTSQRHTMLLMPSKYGKLSVKSICKHLTMQTTVVQVQGRTILNKVWKLLRKTNTAHRIKLFAWKCIRELHNTRYKLSTYNEQSSPHCVICGGREETIEHMIMECDHDKKIWRHLNIAIDIVHSIYPTASEWVENWFLDSNIYNDNDKLLKLMITTWVIWKDRCDVVFQGVTLNHLSYMHKINYHMHSHYHDPLRLNITPSISMTSQWMPPLSNIIKVNVDASFCHDTLATGVVIHTGTGSCEGIKGSFSYETLNPEAGECMAIREALSWAKERRLAEIHVEEDAQLVIKSITEDSLLIKWENKNILREIKYLTSFFQQCSFTNVSIRNNRVADAVAKYVRTTASDINLLNNFPSEFCNLLSRDNRN